MGAAAVGTYRMLLLWAGGQRGRWRAYDWSATDLKKRHRRRVGRVIWFVCRDFDADVCRWCGSSGLPKRNGKPKPSPAQFTRIAAKGR